MFANKMKKRHRFSANVAIHDFGRMKYTVVYLPKRIEKELRLLEMPRLRVEGLIHGEPFSGACQPTGKAWYLILSKRILKEAGLNVGDKVEGQLSIADQEAVDIPEDLQLELDRNSNIRKKWDALSAGKKRGLAYRVASAKRLETREQRIFEVLEVISDS
ncbi:YdeI/OmpD-associated family protein [Rubellicoccus peritrichatus]|uniref:YdeI/OmpD-associated family protein n=1 Tax=Rubellicoccus peritrichatus TaxID=3080537 RepID=A0AAQ3L849_9BACT|nr:YdeI/OmpD-associated family protein [Puniceicoccus sp. CR14]WOO39669.1 YdeI/OmpD-associated family protein [Puniceicoccus sp. CR14]